MENAQQPVELDLNPIARVIGFLGMYVAHVQCAAGYEYGQQRPAAMKGEPDLIDEIMADRQPIVNFMGSGASDQLMIKDIQAALDTYNQLMKVFGQEVQDVEARPVADAAANDAVSIKGDGPTE